LNAAGQRTRRDSLAARLARVRSRARALADLPKGALRPHGSWSSIPRSGSLNDAVIGRQDYPICAHLTARAFGRNIAAIGLVAISGNSIDWARHEMLPALVRPGWAQCWTSQNVPDSWLMFDFHSMRLFVTHYELKTYKSGAGYSHLKSWVLRGKVGHDRWVDLDRRSETVDLNGKSRIGTFFLKMPTEVTAIKLIQTEPNHAGDHYLILTSVEFYGEIIGPF
jgi:hypothetical protein